MHIRFDSHIDFKVFNSSLEEFAYTANRLEHGGRIFCTKGNATVSMNGNTYYLVKNASLAILPYSVLSVTNRTEDFHAVVFVYTVDFFQIASKGLQGLFPYYISHPFIIRTEEDASWILSSLSMLQELAKHKEYHYRIEMGQCILRYLLMNICNQAIGVEPKEEITNAKIHANEYFNRLVFLLSRHCVKQRSVSYYASRLCVSAKHLNEICKRVSHSTVKEVIDQYVITQLKNEIATSDKTIAEISDEYNFPSSSFFCRYFKKFTAVTPMEFRKGISP